MWLMQESSYNAPRLHVAIEARKIVISGEVAGLQIQLGPPAVPGRFNSCDLPPTLLHLHPKKNKNSLFSIDIANLSSVTVRQVLSESMKNMCSDVYRFFMPLFDLYTWHLQAYKSYEQSPTLNDGQGLSLLINPDGSKRWRFRFRFAGEARLMSFGSYDLESLAEAHEKRDTTRKQVANGIDPVEERKAQKQAQQLSTENSFEAICRE